MEDLSPVNEVKALLAWLDLATILPDCASLAAALGWMRKNQAVHGNFTGISQAYKIVKFLQSVSIEMIEWSDPIAQFAQCNESVFKDVRGTFAPHFLYHPLEVALVQSQRNCENASGEYFEKGILVWRCWLVA